MSTKGGICMEEKLTEALMHILKIAWIPILEIAAGAVIGPRVKKIIVRMANKSYNAKNRGLLTFMGSAANILIISLSFILAAEALGLKMNSIISLITALGLGIALALKGNMANVAGGLQILITKPFGVGDYIKIGGHSGVVTAIELMFTTIRTDNQKEVVIPNSTAVEDVLTNYSKYPSIRIRIPFEIPTGTDFVAIQTTVKKILEESPLLLHSEPCEVIVKSISDGYITMEAVGSARAINHHETRSALLEQIALSLPFLQKSSTTNIKLINPAPAAGSAQNASSTTQDAAQAGSVSNQNQSQSPASLIKQAQHDEAASLIASSQAIALHPPGVEQQSQNATNAILSTIKKNIHQEIEKVEGALNPIPAPLNSSALASVDQTQSASQNEPALAVSAEQNTSATDSANLTADPDTSKQTAAKALAITPENAENAETQSAASQNGLPSSALQNSNTH